MKSIAVIKLIVPALSAIQGAGCFSNPLATAAADWKGKLVTAACEDKIDLSDAILAFEEMEAATEFEVQQDAIATTIALLNDMLDDIPAGKMPVYVPPSETRQQVARRLASNIDAVQDCMTVEADRLEQMVKDASMLTSMVRGAIYDGEIDAKEELAAEQTYNTMENVRFVSFGQRVAQFKAANDFAKRMAA